MIDNKDRQQKCKDENLDVNCWISTLIALFLARWLTATMLSIQCSAAELDCDVSDGRIGAERCAHGSGADRTADTAWF
jgi:hypothetical protein